MVWSCLLVAAGLAAAEPSKITICAFETRGPGLSDLAEAALRASVTAAGTLPETLASSARPAPGAAIEALTIGQLGRRVADATGAAMVVFGTLVATGEADTGLFSTAGFDAARGEVLLADPLRIGTQTTRTGLTAAAIGDQVAAVARRWLLPSGRIERVVEDRVAVRLDRAMSLSPAGYDLFLRPAAVASGDDRFALPGAALGSGRLVQSEGERAWFELATAPAAEVGTAVVVAPSGQVPSFGGGEGVVVTSSPAGAVVAVDGRVRGATPLWLPLPPAGELVLALDHPATMPWRDRLGDAARAAGVLAVALASGRPEVAEVAGEGYPIRVESQPPGAQVLVDGERRGLTPLVLEHMAGRPRLRLERDGYRAWSGQVVADGAVTVRAELVPDFGGLEVTSKPPGARLYVDGKIQGKTPLRLTGVPTGRHEIRLIGADGVPVVRQVTVVSGEVAKVAVDVETGRSLAAEGPAPEPGAAPGLADAELQPLRIVWERKVALRDGQMHLVVADLPVGRLVSVTVSPPRSYLTQPLPDGYQLLFSGCRAVSSGTWEFETIPELRALEVKPGERAGDLAVRLRLGDGALIRVHDSSTLHRARLVLLPAGAGG